MHGKAFNRDTVSFVKEQRFKISPMTDDHYLTQAIFNITSIAHEVSEIRTLEGFHGNRIYGALLHDVDFSDLNSAQHFGMEVLKNWSGLRTAPRDSTRPMTDEWKRDPAWKSDGWCTDVTQGDDDFRVERRYVGEPIVLIDRLGNCYCERRTEVRFWRNVTVSENVGNINHPGIHNGTWMRDWIFHTEWYPATSEKTCLEVIPQIRLVASWGDANHKMIQGIVPFSHFKET